jgi:hypothetical protein
MSSQEGPGPAAGDACCGSCGATTRVPVLARPQPPGTAPRGRYLDRWITTVAIAIAAVFVMLAALSLLAPAGVRQGWWLPLHLLLAGGAATAIAGVMPFFSAAVASVAPAPGAVRIAGVAGVAAGAALIVLVRISGPASGGWTGGVAGLVYLAGIGAMAGATLLPLRSALGPRKVVLAASYGVALVCVAIGATLGILALSGWQPILQAWDVSRAAHGWLNVFGFLSLVIAASLIHLLPTVAGCRIDRTRTSMVVLGTLMLGPLLTAAGFLVRSDIVVMTGSLLVLVGACALVRYAIDVGRRRGRWSTHPDWHRFAFVSLLCAIGWFTVGTALATAKAWHGGATTLGWDLTWLLAPLALGWATQALVGSWTHLVPSIGPGTPRVHAAQRRVLGYLALPRLVAYQVGVGLLTLGIPSGHHLAAGIGLAAVVGCLVVAGVLLVVVGWQLRGGRSPAAIPVGA